MARPKPKHHHRAVFFPDKQELSGPNADGRGLGYVQAWHRTSWEASPFCIPNEYICGEIGRFLRLPIPPFSITYGVDDKYFFTSLNFNFDREEQLPPIEPDVTWNRLQSLCTGVLLFDILIANSDRHDANLAADSVGSPNAISVFDHDQALFGGGFPLKGIDRLNALTGRLGISNGEVTQGNRHCLLDVANSSESFGEWFKRIESIPDWFIDEVCSEAGQYGLSADEVETVQMFLKHRRNSIEQIIKDSAKQFTLITSWPWDGGLFK